MYHLMQIKTVFSRLKKGEKENMSTEEKIELSDGEILRISVREDPETGKVSVCSDANGNRAAMIAALQVICEENFGMLCIPACSVMTIKSQKTEKKRFSLKNLFKNC